MLKRLVCAILIAVAVWALLAVSACGHYTAKGRLAELVWKNWAGV